MELLHTAPRRPEKNNRAKARARELPAISDHRVLVMLQISTRRCQDTSYRCLHRYHDIDAQHS
jgi:hypothetical protein